MQHIRPLSVIVFLWVALSGLCSCVGTVEDKNPETTKGSSAPITPFNFEGIFDAVAISPEKVEVFFYPASGSPTDLTYVVNYDGSPLPSTFPAATLRPDYRGLLKATIANLTINTFYTFSVQVKNSIGSISSNTITQTVRTFSNVTCDFPAISRIGNLSGEEGRNALRIDWPEARREGSEFVKKPIDPDQYEIVALDSGSLTPAAFDDEFFGEPQRKVKIIDGKKISHQLNGLQPGTEYFVRVRCIHYDFNQNGSDVGYKREQNSEYLVGETFSDDLSSIDVDLTDFDVSPANGAAGLNAFDVSWDPAEGAFSEYRIYYRNINDSDGPLPWSSFKASKNDVCNGEEPSNPGWFCKKVNFSESSVVLADLDSLADFEVVGVICLTNDCSNGNFLEYVSNSPYRTFPGLSSFGGITSIDLSTSLFDLSTVYLNFTPPDLNSGASDGLLVEAKARAPLVDDSFLNHPTEPNITNLSFESFDYTQDTTVAVSGLDVGGDPYCFTLLPFIFDSTEVSGIKISREGEIVRCVTLAFEPPLSSEFSGINVPSSFLDTSTNSATIVWDTPSGGQYDRFIVFVKLDGTPGPFNFADATNSLSPNYNDYVKIDAGYGVNSYFLGFLPEGNYQIGVLTYFGLIDEYSEFNNNLLNFDTTLP